MRTTLNLNDQLLEAARARARASGRTLTFVIEEALRLALRDRPQAASKPVRLPRSKGRGLPLIDLTSTSAVLAQLDEWDAADRRQPTDR